MKNKYLGAVLVAALSLTLAACTSEKLGKYTGHKPPPPEAAASVGEGSVQVYTIKPGDTLYKIATQHKTTVADLIKLNPKLSAHPAEIKAGEKINIPA